MPARRRSVSPSRRGSRRRGRDARLLREEVGEGHGVSEARPRRSRIPPDNRVMEGSAFRGVQRRRHRHHHHDHGARAEGAARRRPRGAHAAARRCFLSYVLSFVYVGIYWNNPPPPAASARIVSGAVLWANLLLLFWLSLFPFATGVDGREPLPAQVLSALYGDRPAHGGPLVFAAAAHDHRRRGRVVAAPQRRWGATGKGARRRCSHAIGIAGAFWSHWIAEAISIGVALMWLVPDRRIERALAQARRNSPS